MTEYRGNGTRQFSPPSELDVLRPDFARPKARISTHDGWWFRYAVHRTKGIGIPEHSCSLHRTLKGAERAAERWVKQDTPRVLLTLEP